MTPEQLAKSGSEDAHQMALFAWARLEEKRYPMLKWMHAIPNGGLRSARTGAKMKATGARKGVWDIFLPVPTWVQEVKKVSLGLYIEMKKPALVVNGKKTSAGTLTPEQKEYRQHLTFYAYDSVVCYTWEEARDAILAYLSEVPASEIEQYKEYTR